MIKLGSTLAVAAFAALGAVTATATAMATPAPRAARTAARALARGAPLATEVLTVETEFVYATGASTAIVEGTVEDARAGEGYLALYAPAASEWCSSEGEGGEPQATAFEALTEAEVQVEVVGLEPGRSYCVALAVEEHSAGPTAAFGEQLTFTAGAPSLGPVFAEALTASSELIGAEANFAGQPAQYRVLYGPADSSWCTSAAEKGEPAGETDWTAPAPQAEAGEFVEAEVAGLQGGGKYCAQMQLKNETAGADSEVVDFTAGLASVLELEAFATGPHSEIFDGAIELVGQASTYFVEYAPASSTWCLTLGARGEAQHSASAVLEPSKGELQEVEAPVEGLVTGERYCGELVVENASGSSSSQLVRFKAAQPSAIPDEAIPQSPEEALLIGEVDPAGEPAKYWAEYAPAGSPNCTTFAESDAQVPPQTLEAESGFEEVELTLTRLHAGTEYCVQLYAANPFGATERSQATLDEIFFVAGAPTAHTEPVVASTQSTATVQGQIETAEQPTSYRLLYSPASSRWCRSEGEAGEPQSESESQTLSGEGEGFQRVQVEIGGLSPGSAYCAELSAENTLGSAPSSAPVSFETQAPEASPPSISNAAVTRTTASTATLEAELNPGGAQTSYWAEYAAASSQWCQTGGAEGEAEQQSAPVTLPAEDHNSHAVQIEVVGLAPASEYCGSIAAKNGKGEAPKVAPVPFQTSAAAPIATTTAASTGSSTATVEGEVNPGGTHTTYWADYANASSEWCMSDGEKGEPELKSAIHTLLEEDDSPHAVQVELGGLAPTSAYCAAIAAKNSEGEAVSSTPVAFQTGAGAPTATTTAAVATGSDSATVEGEVDPNGSQTSYWAQYGTASSEWCTSHGEAGEPERQSAPEPLHEDDEGGAPHVEVELSELEPASEYCAAIAATNGAGEASPITPVAFKTDPAAPSVATSGASASASTTATVDGEVDPNGAQSTYWADYASTSSEWCRSNGTAGFFEKESPTATLAFEDNALHPVQVQLNGLAPGSEYCAALAAENEESEDGPTVATGTVTFKTDSASSSSSSSPAPETPTQSSGGVLGTMEEVPPAEEPQLGVQAVLGTVSGTVEVKRKGSKSYVLLTSGSAIPDGSEIEATEGRVSLTVVLPSGATQTAEAFGGRFSIEQEADGFTKLVLTLPLSGCKRVPLPHGTASAASIVRTQPLHRHLWVTEKGGQWGTNGRFASTSVEGTTWLTTDDCKRSIVFVKQGRVRVRNLVTKKTKVLTAGQSYTAKAKRKRKRRRGRHQS